MRYSLALLALLLAAWVAAGDTAGVVRGDRADTVQIVPAPAGTIHVEVPAPAPPAACSRLRFPEVTETPCPGLPDPLHRPPVDAADTQAPAPPPPAQTPPVDLPRITQFGFDATEAPGWYVRPRDAQPTQVQDPSGPMSPPEAVQFNFPRGLRDGLDAGVSWTNFSVAEVLVRVWFMVGEGWQHHPNNFKHVFLLTNGRRIYSNFTPGGYIGALNNNDDGIGPTPNIGGTCTRGCNRARGTLPEAARVRPGQWQLLEIHGRMNGDGTALVQWWVDGTPIGRSERENIGASRFTEFNIVGTWGGGGGSKTRDDWIRYDHVEVYGR